MCEVAGGGGGGVSWGTEWGSSTFCHLSGGDGGRGGGRKNIWRESGVVVVKLVVTQTKMYPTPNLIINDSSLISIIKSTHCITYYYLFNWRKSVAESHTSATERALIRYLAKVKSGE